MNHISWAPAEERVSATDDYTSGRGRTLCSEQNGVGWLSGCTMLPENSRRPGKQSLTIVHLPFLQWRPNGASEALLIYWAQDWYHLFQIITWSLGWVPETGTRWGVGHSWWADVQAAEKSCSLLLTVSALEGRYYYGMSCAVCVLHWHFRSKVLTFSSTVSDTPSFMVWGRHFNSLN